MDYRPYPVQPANPCPNCGYCPHCRRHDYNRVTYFPYTGNTSTTSSDWERMKKVLEDAQTVISNK
jgi:hypothetical protein